MTLRSRPVRPLVGVLAAFLFVSAAAGQVLDPSVARVTSSYGVGSYYRYVGATEIGMRVQVWGALRAPGYYEIPQGTSLTRVLSLAGGPAFSRERERGERRTIRLQLFRPSADTMAVVFEQQMLNDVAQLTRNPALQEGDLVVVNVSVRRREDRLRDIAPYIVSGASILASIVSAIIVSRN